MENNFKRFLSLLLAFVMVIGMFPMTHAHAAEAACVLGDKVTDLSTINDETNVVLCLKDTYLALENDKTSNHSSWAGKHTSTKKVNGIVAFDTWYNLEKVADGQYKLKNVEKNLYVSVGTGMDPNSDNNICELVTAENASVLNFEKLNNAWGIGKPINNGETRYLNNLGNTGNIGGWHSNTTNGITLFDIYLVVEADDTTDPYGKLRGLWSTEYCSSTSGYKNETEGEFEKAFDNNPGTQWHAYYGSYEDRIPSDNGGTYRSENITGIIDLGATYTLNWFSYTPRTTAASGHVTQASLYVSTVEDPAHDNAEHWTPAAEHVTFTYPDGNRDAEQIISFTTQSVRYVKFVAERSNDGWVTASEFDVGYDPTFGKAIGAWKASATSEAPVSGLEGGVNLAIDNNNDTFWHSNWYNDGGNLKNGEISAELDLGAVYTINQFSFLPRQNRLSGSVIKADLQVKVNAEDEWTTVATDATFIADQNEKTFCFDAQPVRYVKFIAKEANVYGDETAQWVCIAEFDVDYEDGHAITTTVTAPTCVADGYTTYSCSCGNYSYTITDADSATGEHTWGEWGTTTSSTCKVAGEKRRDCANCDAFETEALPLAEHTPGTPAQENVVAPGCATAGSYNTVTRCTECNEVITTVPGTTPATGEHDWGAWNVTKPATLNEKGEERRDCTNCNAFETQDIPMLTGAVAESDGIKYATLAEAIEKSSKTVTLLADVTLTERLDIAKYVVLELNGHTISGDFVDQFGMIYVKKGAFLNLRGKGSVVAEKTHAIGNYGAVLVMDCSIISNADEDYAGLYNFYYQPGYYGSATIASGSVDSVFNCGTLTVNGGTVAYLDNSGKLVVTGGTINTLYARDGSDAAGVIGAGTITIADTENVTVPEGYKLVEIETGVYQVVAKTYVAEVGGVKYETLQAAFDAAKANDTIVLLADVTLDTYLNVTTAGKIFLNLDGHKIIRDGNTGIYVNNADTVLTITGYGSVSGEQAVFAADGKVIILNGTFYGTGDAIYAYGNGHIEIYGGSFSAADGAGTANAYCVLNQHDGTRKTSSITVYGGTFVGFDPANNLSEGKNTNFVAEGYCSRETDGSWTVVKDHISAEAVKENEVAPTLNSTGSYDSVVYCSACGKELNREEVTVPVLTGAAASINGYKYASFKDAVAAATDGDTITLLVPVTITEDTTIDLTGKTLDGNGVYPAIRVQNGATLTIKGGEFVNATDYLFTLGSSDKTQAGNLVIEGGSFKAMTTIASVTKGTLTIKGGSFECFDSEYGAAYMLNCYDESYKNGVAQIIVNGGTFVGFNPANNASEGENTNFVAEGYCSRETDGSWTVYNEHAYADVYTDPTFEADGFTTYTCACGHSYTEIDEGSKLVAIAVIGEQRFVSLQAAFGAAKANDTITLLADVTLDTYLNVTTAGAITLDLDSHSITRDGGTAIYVNHAATILTITGNGSVSGEQAVFAADGKVIIENGTFYGTGDAIYAYGNGHIEIYGGSFSAADGAGTANAYCVLNQHDGTRETSSITVYGGTFKGFNPANNLSEGENTNFVAEGYCSALNAEGNYTVQKHAEAEAVVENEVAATCGADGSYDTVVYCSFCKTELSRVNTVVPATGEHTPSDPVKENEVAPTLNSTGSYDSVVYCSVCDAELSRKTVEIPVVEEKITLVGYEAVYGSEVGMRVYLNIPESMSNVKIVMSKDGAWGTVTQEFNVDDMQVISGNGKCVSIGVASGEMARTISVQVLDADGNALMLYTSNGEEYANIWTGSVAAYVKDMLKSDMGEENKAAAEALLVYGGYAQQYFDVDAETPVYDGVVTPDLSGVTAEKLANYATTQTNGNFSVKVVNIEAYLDYSIYHRVYMTVAEGTNINDYTFKVSGPDRKDVVLTVAYDTANKLYYVDITDIAAAYMDDEFTITISDANGGSNVITTCALSWARSVLNYSKDNEQINLAKAMYLYNQAANELFGK